MMTSKINTNTPQVKDDFTPDLAGSEDRYFPVIFSTVNFIHIGTVAPVTSFYRVLYDYLVFTTDQNDTIPGGERKGDLQKRDNINQGCTKIIIGRDGNLFTTDLTIGWSVSEIFYVGLDAASASDNFCGLAGYFQNATNETKSLSMRQEYIYDGGLGMLRSKIGQQAWVRDFTLLENDKDDHLTTIPEVRFDPCPTVEIHTMDFDHARQSDTLFVMPWSTFINSEIEGID